MGSVYFGCFWATSGCWGFGWFSLILGVWVFWVLDLGILVLGILVFRSTLHWFCFRGGFWVGCWVEFGFGFVFLFALVTCIAWLILGFCV